VLFRSQDAVNVNEGRGNMSWLLSTDKLKKLGIHASETSWVGTEFDAILNNNTSIDDLFSQVKNLVSDPLASKVDLAREVVVGSWRIPS
jgi:hypothetical protein